MHQAQLSAWRHHPLTQVVLTFLTDYADQLRADHADRFEGGALLPDGGEDVARGYINALRDIAKISSKTVNDFYQPQQPQEEKNDLHTNSNA